MGSANSRVKRRRPPCLEEDVVVTSYTSMMKSNHPDFRRIRTASGIPLPVSLFTRISAHCPLPQKIFTPFPPIDQAIGCIVKSFDALPSTLCYHRFIKKHPANRLSHRIDCLFLPNDEAHLMVCSGLYLLRNDFPALRINHLYDGLVSQWRFGALGCSDHCTVVRGSRSNNASNFAISRLGRFMAWPSDSGIVVFDRFAATTCRRECFSIGDSAKAVDFSPDRLHLAVVSSGDRHFLLRIVSNFNTGRTPFQVLQEIDLTRIDHTMVMRPGSNDLANVRFSPSGRSIAVASEDGHFMVLSVLGGDLPALLVMPHSFRTPDNVLRFRQMHLASHKAFDFAAAGSVDDGFDRVALATCFGEVILCSLGLRRMESVLARTQVIPIHDEDRRINCLRFGNVEPWLAVALSSGEVLLLDSGTLQPLSKLPLEIADFGPPLAHCLIATHGFTSLSFSCTDSYLAAGATDGRIRIWCIKRMIGSLTELCRRVIRGLVPEDQVPKLPLHPVIHEYLSESLSYRTDGGGYSM